MPTRLTLLPIAWTLQEGQREAIAYSVEGLPGRRATISSGPGGWRVVVDSLSNFDQEKRFSTAEQAADALKAWIESVGSNAAE
jgi:hypothetical protein